MTNLPGESTPRWEVISALKDYVTDCHFNCNIRQFSAVRLVRSRNERICDPAKDTKPFHLIKLAPLREHIERVGIIVYPAEEA